MLFLYNLPGWLMAVCIVGTVVGLAYPGYFLIRQVWRRSFTDVETNVSMAVLTVIATIYALLLAFVAVSVWQSFGAAETAVVNEANSVGQLARDLSIFDSAESLEVASDLIPQSRRDVSGHTSPTIDQAKPGRPRTLPLTRSRPRLSPTKVPVR